MTAQNPVEVVCELNAYAFLVKHRGAVCHTAGAIASCREEALAELKRRHDYLSQDELEFIGDGFATMQPAMIERLGRDKTVKEKGFYAFLSGHFFVVYGDQRLVYRCAKRKTSTGWMAAIYGGSYYVTLLDKAS